MISTKQSQAHLVPTFSHLEFPLNDLWHPIFLLIQDAQSRLDKRAPHQSTWQYECLECLYLFVAYSFIDVYIIGKKGPCYVSCILIGLRADI